MLPVARVQRFVGGLRTDAPFVVLWRVRLSQQDQPSRESNTTNVTLRSHRFSPTNHGVDQAKAHEIHQLGVAEAAAILAKGEAEAKVRGSACFVYFGSFNRQPPCFSVKRFRR